MEWADIVAKANKALIAKTGESVTVHNAPDAVFRAIVHDSYYGPVGGDAADGKIDLVITVLDADKTLYSIKRGSEFSARGKRYVAESIWPSEGMHNVICRFVAI